MKVALATCASVAVVVLAAGSAPASQPASPCPTGPLPFGANPIAPATRAALAREDPQARPQVVAAAVASGDVRGRGSQVKPCGRVAFARTVVAYITLRKFLPSASLSQRVSFVSRFSNGWRVWYVAH